MDAEIFAVLVILGVALLPIAFAFRSRGMRIALAIYWLAIGFSMAPQLLAYRATHLPQTPDNRPVEVLREDHVSSKECGACHPAEYNSWKNTWHRTMTQVATPEAVIGDFNNVKLKSSQFQVELRREGDKFAALIHDPTLGEDTWREIVLTTGSHHMQAYWYSRGPDLPLGQLPFSYLKNDARWVPDDATFTQPPDHTTIGLGAGRWNHTCIHCHTTRGRPGILESNPLEAKSDVVEFGIACEACHGPGGEHTRANRENPARRYVKHLADKGDDTIVNAARLSKERSAEVCGQCHGIGAVPDDKAAANWRGYDYSAGDELDTTGRSILRGGENYPHEPSPEAQAYHDTMYWTDGMVRVSGREVNGLYDSPCYERGEMTCLSCHLMHKPEDDPRSNLEWADDLLSPGMRTNQACLQCHSGFERKLEAHTNHSAASTGSECMNCHMPYTTWGLLKGIRQHTVSSPSVSESIETGRPNACNACHLDESLAWSALHLAQWYAQPIPELDEEQTKTAASLLWLLKGDAGQRVLTAWYFGWQPATENSGTDWIAPQLATVLEDPYAAVRYGAEKSLRKLIGFEDFRYDYVGAPDDFRSAAREIVRRYDALRSGRELPGEYLDPSRAERLLLFEDGSINRMAQTKLLKQRDERTVMLAE